MKIAASICFVARLAVQATWQGEHVLDLPQTQRMPGQIVFSTDPMVLQQQRDDYDAVIAKQLTLIGEKFEKLEETIRTQHQQRLQSASHRKEAEVLLQLEVDEEFRSSQVALRERFNKMKMHASDEGKRVKEAQFLHLEEQLRIQANEIDMAYKEQLARADSTFEMDIDVFARAGQVLFEQHRRVAAENRKVLEERRRWFPQHHTYDVLQKSMHDFPQQPMHDFLEESIDDFPQLSMHNLVRNLKRNMADL